MSWSAGFIETFFYPDSTMTMKVYHTLLMENMSLSYITVVFSWLQTMTHSSLALQSSDNAKHCL